MRSKAIREENKQEADAYNEHGYNSENQAQPLKLHVHEVRDDQRGLDY